MLRHWSIRALAIANSNKRMIYCSRLVPSSSSDNKMTHIDPEGKATMVDVGKKDISSRTAVARARYRFPFKTPQKNSKYLRNILFFYRINIGQAAFQAIESAAVKKGDVLAVSELAGVIAAKNTGHVIPLCHVIPLDAVNVYSRLAKDENSEEFFVDIECVAKCTGKIGTNTFKKASATLITV